MMKSIQFKEFFNKFRFFVISFLSLLVWITFFDRSNLVKQGQLALKLNSLSNQEKYFQQEIENILAEEHEVLGNYSSMEKYARENYFLKKEGETVFVLVDKNDQIING